MKLTESLEPSEINRLAKSLARLGWGGFLVQVLIGAIPSVMMLYMLVFGGTSGEDAGARLPFIQLFSMIDLALLVFVSIWFFGYARLGKRMRTTPDRVTLSATRGAIWVGLIATTLAILFSMLVLLFEVGTMLFFFLSLPQGMFAAFQGPAAGSANWIAAVDIISLMSVVISLGGEVAALIFGLVLLNRVVQVSLPESRSA